MAIGLTSFNRSFKGHFPVKYHILGLDCSGMHGNTTDFGFPMMSEDPFSSSPLGKDEVDMLVGRHGLFEELERKITFKSANRVLLVGEFGSGKTSFMQCLGARTNLHLSIDRIAIAEPGIELLKDMFAQLIDGSPPHDYQKLSRDLHRMMNDTRQMLPLITVDADMADVSSLEACLRSSLPFFERLPALIVVAINPQQQSLISEQILQRFEVRNMSELDIDGVKALVERRIARATQQPYKFETDDAERLLQMSQSGQPGAIIRVLRNVVSGRQAAVDNTQKHVESNPVETATLVEKEPLEPKHVDEIPAYDEHQDIEKLEAEENNPESWEVSPGMTQTSGFDLDFQVLDEPVEEPETLTDEGLGEVVEDSFEDSYLTEDSLPFTGVFGGLRNRRKIINNELEETPEGQFKETEKGTAFWSAEDSISIDETIQPLDEIDDQMDDEGMKSNIYHNTTERSEGVRAQDEQLFDTSAIETFTRLLAQVLEPNHLFGEGDDTLVERLRNLSRPKLADKEEHVLNVAVLSSLTNSESIVVAEAKGRNISPSDSMLLHRLSIKRARLSQICNRLHKAGILHARTVGRSRMFGLTRSALAQLIAWGLIGGDE